MKKRIYLRGLKNNKIQGVRALRCLPSMGLEEAISLVNTVALMYGKPLEECPCIEVETADFPLLGEQFHFSIDEPQDDQRFLVPTATVLFPGGAMEVYGDAKDVADVIYRLLEEGHPRDKIRIDPHGAFA
jgi:hypothetical protein